MSTEARVTTLEQAMLRAEASIQRLAEETRAFEREMRVFQDEVRAVAPRDRPRAFKGEIGLSSEDMRASADRWDRRWGELANKMGTLVEDIVAPGISWSCSARRGRSCRRSERSASWAPSRLSTSTPLW